MPITLVSELHLNCLEGSNRKLLFDLTPLSNLIYQEYAQELGIWAPQRNYTKSTTFFGISFLYWKKAVLTNKETQISTVLFSYAHPQGTCRGWIGGAELLWIKEAPLSVEVFQQPHHNRSLIITQPIQNSACSTFSTNVLRCLTDGEKRTTGKMLVPDYSDSSRARAAVLGPESRTINSLHWTSGSLARKALCLSGLPQPTDLLKRTPAFHLLSSTALQAYIGETSIDYVLPGCSIFPRHNTPLYPLPAHTPGTGKVDEAHPEIPSLTLEQASKLSVGWKRAKIPGLRTART